MKRNRWLYALVIFIVLALDQGLKMGIKLHYALYDLVYQIGFINIQYVENPGMAFGFEFGGLAGKIALTLFRFVSIIVLFVGGLNLLKNNSKTAGIMAYALIFAGAVGNFLDSTFYGVLFDTGTTWNETYKDWFGYADVSSFGGGYSSWFQGCVVDMIHFEFYYPSWMPFGLSGREIFPPVFNIADSAITVGVSMLVLFNKRWKTLERALNKHIEK